MTGSVTTAPRVSATPAGLLLAGFAAAVGVRVAVGGVGVSQSPSAGLVFAGLLLALSATARTRVPMSWRATTLGLAGVVLLCLPVVLTRGDRPLHDATGFVPWALVVTVVAVAEEVFLRGALYDAIDRVTGPTAAIVVTAAAFAALHVPLYGWQVVPLDLAVGVLLGELRRRSQTPLAPAITHVGADLAAWFLR
jgi:membrane protease YdiL (CAAX protease family)